MKKRKRPTGSKARKSRRKPIMRHSREGARPHKRRPKKKTAKTAKKKTAKTAKKKMARRVKPARAKSATGRKKTAKSRTARRRGAPGLSFEPLPDERGRGAEAGGQSGDTEGLSRYEEADSESVEELMEEGQALEAGTVGGGEEADGHPHEVKASEVREDDVPQEYLDEE